MGLRRASVAVLLSLSLSSAGCGLRLVSLTDSIDSQIIIKIDETNAPVRVNADGRRSIHVQPTLDSSVEQVTLPYDSLLWTTTKMPFVRADEAAGKRDLILIDTGLLGAPVVTLDVVARRQLPANLGEPPFAYAKSLSMSGITFKDLLAWIEDQTWQFRVLGIPVYRLSSWVLGMPLLRKAHYLCFDNDRGEVTFGVKSSFQPDPGWQWEEFEMTYPDGRPWVKLPVAGKEMMLLADSGGGPHLILNRAEWEVIADDLEIVRHNVDQYPTWGGFQQVDAYKVKTLALGPIVHRNALVWVQRKSERPVPPSCIGLGPFRDSVVVFDFERSKLWIRSKRKEEAR